MTDEERENYALKIAIERIDGLGRLWEERQRQVSETNGRILESMRRQESRQDAADARMVTFDARMTEMKASTETSLREIKESQADMKVEIAALKPISLRNRLIAFGALMGGIGLAIGGVAKPVVDLADLVGKMFRGH
jgi:predicted  nucleic acid-binding Zn-ribbon protein